MEQETRVTMQSAETEVTLLKSLAGIEENNCLDAADWESSYTFR